MYLKNISMLLLAACALATSTNARPVSSLSPDIGQLNAEFELQESLDESDLVYAVQRTRDDRIFLTPDNGYLKCPVLHNGGEGVMQKLNDESDRQRGTRVFGRRGVNSGASHAFIHRWGGEEPVAQWGLWIERIGPVKLHINTGGATGAEFRVELDGDSASFKSAGGSDDEIHLAASVELNVSRPGFHVLSIAGDKNMSRDLARNVRLHWIELEGQAAENAAVARVRWRPAATHARFSSSRMDSSRKVRMWVIEQDGTPGEHGFYAPIVTPFGYYGSGWRADGTVGGGINFSLWSYGRHQDEPPIERLSQIIAIGDPSARFGGFGHEGTGVKIRGWSPLQGRNGQRQAFALRVEPGVPTEYHDTYYAYFYANDLQQWVLYGVGENFNGGRFRGRAGSPEEMSMRIGSFVEVLGGPNRRRTGPYERRMRYRGWVMDEEENWYPIDRMTYGNINRQTGLTHTHRGIDEDGWFFNQTGGWALRRPDPEAGRFVAHPAPSKMTDVSYMTAEDMDRLMSLPSEVSVVRAAARGGRLRVQYEVENAGPKAKVTAFWGAEDARAIKSRWHASEVLTENASEGISLAEIGIGEIEGEVYVRLLLENSEGRFFSKETARIEL